MPRVINEDAQHWHKQEYKLTSPNKRKNNEKIKLSKNKLA